MCESTDVKEEAYPIVVKMLKYFISYIKDL